MAIVTGTVEGFNTKFGKYSVLVNGTWYGTKEEWAKVKPVNGDVVEFDDGGAKYTKNMRVVTSGGSAAPSGGGSAPAKPSGGYSRGSFPIGLEDGQRSIIRQNALTNARELVSKTVGLEFDPSATVELIIDIAREFEAYTAGDIERYEAEAKKEEMADAFSAE